MVYENWIPPVLLIILGIILENNASWFNGAHDVGVICIIIGVVLAILNLIGHGTWYRRNPPA